VVLRWKEALQPQEAVALVAQVEIALDIDGFADERRVVLGLRTLTIAISFTTAVATAAPATAVAGLAVVTGRLNAPLARSGVGTHSTLLLGRRLGLLLRLPVLPPGRRPGSRFAGP